jgi:alpha-D-ribose 1-methylphosphonate 5-triphosphate synthase subunit PhnG
MLRLQLSRVEVDERLPGGVNDRRTLAEAVRFRHVNEGVGHSGVRVDDRKHPAIRAFVDAIDVHVPREARHDRIRTLGLIHEEFLRRGRAREAGAAAAHGVDVWVLRTGDGLFETRRQTPHLS